MSLHSFFSGSTVAGRKGFTTCSRQATAARNGSRLRAIRLTGGKRYFLLGGVPGLACVCAALFALGGTCDRPLSLAVGPAGDVTVFTTLAEESPELRALLEGLEKEVVIIGKPEPAFRVEVSGSDGFNIRRNWRNLIFVGSLDEESWVSEMIEELLSAEHLGQLRGGEQNLFFVKDKWAVGQMIAVVSSTQRTGLAGAVQDNAETLFETLDRAVVENTRRIMLRKDVQRDTARYLRREYGWEVILPTGFEGIQDSEHQVAIFRMEEPTRIVLVHWRDDFKGQLTAETCLSIRAEIAWNYYDEDRVDRELTSTARTTFIGRDALKLNGIWQNEKHVSGGPFRSYCFLEGRRLYLVDLVVFAPGIEKLPYLRELEAIAQTFSAG